MTGVHDADDQSLTQEQQSIRTYRTSSASVRHKFSVLLGLREPDELAEGQAESDEPAGPVTKKRRPPSNEGTAPKRPRPRIGPSPTIEFEVTKNRGHSALLERFHQRETQQVCRIGIISYSKQHRSKITFHYRKIRLLPSQPRHVWSEGPRYVALIQQKRLNKCPAKLCVKHHLH